MLNIKVILYGILTSVIIPLQVGAYFTPEEVLLSEDYFKPPSTRETEIRVAQQNEMGERKILMEIESLQETLDSLKGESEEVATEEGEGETNTVLLVEDLSEEDLELLRTIRLLDARENRLIERIEANQYEMNQSYHSGAPPLAPTGAGGILTAITMIGAVLWTIWQVRHSKSAMMMDEERE